MEIKLKRVPFDIELAKKIIEGKINGAKIMTGDYKPARIVAFDTQGEYPITALVFFTNREAPRIFTNKGQCYHSKTCENDLCLYVPINYNNYSDFVPNKWQPCLVRESFIGHWQLRVATGEKSVINCKPLFYEDARSCKEVRDNARTFTYMLPISKKTIQLLGTTKSYEQLLEEEWTNEE